MPGMMVGEGGALGIADKRTTEICAHKDVASVGFEGFLNWFTNASIEFVGFLLEIVYSVYGLPYCTF